MSANDNTNDNTTSEINAEQPKPKETTRRPAWELVVEYAEGVYPSEEPVVALIIADMKERDRVGRERYGVPLTADNGRDHLIDAYQEGLDYAVYLMTFLDEKGVITADGQEAAKRYTAEVESVAGLFAAHMAYLPKLRELIEIRKAKPASLFSVPSKG